MSIWFIGFLFTIGYYGFIERDDSLSCLDRIAFLVCAVVLWPLMLGVHVGGHLRKDRDK